MNSEKEGLKIALTLIKSLKAFVHNFKSCSEMFST